MLAHQSRGEARPSGEEAGVNCLNPLKGTGENATLWRNMTSSFLDFVSYALNAQWAKVCGSGVSCEGGGDRSMDQRPLLILLPIWMALLSFMMHTDSEVSSTGNPASQNIPRDIKGRCRPGKMLALSAWRGRLMPRCVISNDAMCVLLEWYYRLACRQLYHC